jgi:hypothetical protein
VLADGRFAAGEDLLECLGRGCAVMVTGRMRVWGDPAPVTHLRLLGRSYPSRVDVHLLSHARHAKNLDGSTVQQRGSSGEVLIDGDFDDVKICGQLARSRPPQRPSPGQDAAGVRRGAGQLHHRHLHRGRRTAGLTASSPSQ